MAPSEIGLIPSFCTASLRTDVEIDIYREVSTFDQEDRWQSEGVQIGGTGSAFGAVGCWSPYEHNSPRDPAGPFWMWKIGGASD